MIEGEFSDYLTHMINNNIKAGRSVSGNVAIIDGYDGAVHVSSTNNEIGIVSYSSLLFHESFFVHGITTATSGNILTWMQSITDETRDTLLPLLIPIYESQKKLRETASTTHEGATFYYYQCHDAKCIYVLTGHAHFTRLKKPYLLCKCDRGDGARDPNHVCTFISDNEQVELYDKAEEQWNRHEHDPNYTEDEHREWVANKNDGVSNRGVHPLLLVQSSIRPDVFHLGCIILF